MTSSNLIEFHPSDGLSQDINEFLTEFKKRNSYFFSDFAGVWREKCFLELISGRLHVEILNDFLRCLFHYLVDLIQISSDKLGQTCAMYMMYGFYGKLPSKDRVFFRVTLAQWKTINDLVQFYREEEHLDCLYVFNWLCSVGAFQFCATRQPNYPHVPLYANLENIRSIVYSAENDLPASGDKESHLILTLEKLSEEQKKYFEIKKTLLPIAKNSLGLVREDCFDIAINEFKEESFKNRQNAPYINTQPECSEASSSSAVVKKESIVKKKPNMRLRHMQLFDFMPPIGDQNGVRCCYK